MGAWADKYLATLPEADLAAYEAILNRETIDLYNYATGKAAVPPEIDGPVMASIKAFVASAPLGRADPKAYEKVKKVMSN